MKLPVTALGPLVAAIVWTIALVADPGPWEAHSVLLIGLGLLASSAVSVAGIVVVGGRWASRLGWAVIAATAAVAMPLDMSPWWFAGVIASALGGVGLIGAARHVRTLPSATGPPRRAVLLPIVLLGVPFLLGITAFGPAWAAYTLGVSAPVAAFSYSRVVPGGLIGVRVAWPLLAITVALFMPWPLWLLAVALAAVVLTIAWHPTVKVAFHPPREVGSTFPIPPELTPKEILDSAGLDERGRRK